MPHKASCLCEQVQFELNGESQFDMLCHCKHCQKSSGSPFSANAMFKLDELKLIKGQPKVYITKGNSGADVERFFCANCGSTLYTVAPKAGLVFVKTGAFDEKVDFFQPKVEHFVSRAQPWSPHIDGIPQKDVT